MKKTGILNPALGQLLARTGHTDYFTICDKGYPVPDGPERIDLSLVEGIPTVIEVLTAIHTEYEIDRIVIADETAEISPLLVAELKALLGAIPIETMSHLELKHLAATGKATVRTGDATPYANVIVVSG